MGPIRPNFHPSLIHVGNLIIIQMLIISHWRKLRNIFKRRPTCGVGGFQNPCSVASSTVLIGLITLRPDYNSHIMCTGGFLSTGAERKVGRVLGISQIRPPGSWGQEIPLTQHEA